MSTIPVVLSASALLMTGVTGSLHCALMCGALSARLTQGTPTPSSLWLLHGSRIIGYGLLGVLAGALGSALLPHLPSAKIGLWLQGAAALLLIGMGLRQLQRLRQPRQCCAAPPMPRPAMSIGKNLLLGLGWTLTPCPFKYSMLMLAGLSGSVIGGATLMSAFALGSSPLLILVGGLTQAGSAAGVLPRVLPRAGAMLMLGLGGINLLMIMTASTALASWGWCAAP